MLATVDAGCTISSRYRVGSLLNKIIHLFNQKFIYSIFLIINYKINEFSAESINFISMDHELFYLYTTFSILIEPINSHKSYAEKVPF
jgi:hypothetical protein